MYKEIWDNYSVFYMLGFFKRVLAPTIFVIGLLIYFHSPLSIFLTVLFIYFLPGVIIYYRYWTGDLRKKTSMGDTTSKYARTIQDVTDDVPHVILVVNLILGWTIIVWFVCLYFALTEEYENLY